MKIKYYEIYKRLNENNYSITPTTELFNCKPVELISVVENIRVAEHFCQTHNKVGEEPCYFYEEIRAECFNTCEDDECMDNPDTKVCNEINKDESIEDKDSKIAFLESQVRELVSLLYTCNFEDLLVNQYGECVGYAWNGFIHYDENRIDAEERFSILNDILTIRRDDE